MSLHSYSRGLPRVVALTIVTLLLAAGAVAQETRDPGPVTLPYARSIQLQDLRSAVDRLDLVNNGLPNVLLTGYWPPTNEMLRQFSPNPEQNPDGWVGENWEGRGYNVYAFFPEFPGGTGVNPKGDGDFEVDYQDTSGDFWPLVEQLRPIAIVAYGRSGNDFDWELEGGHRMYSLSAWTNDYLTPYDPTPELPIAGEIPGTERYSTLPMQDVIDAIIATVPNLYPYSTTIDTSRFLCDFMGYHVNWYHDLHTQPADPAWNVTAGFIHLGYAMELDDAVAGNEVTVRTVIAHVDVRVIETFDINADGFLNVADVEAQGACLAGPDVLTPPAGVDPTLFAKADIDEDGDVDLADAGILQVRYMER
ncbi:MAG: hypothetical protein PVJ57_18605 [Phycisphaerae bacterium]|jgi:hypothetical protein